MQLLTKIKILLGLLLACSPYFVSSQSIDDLKSSVNKKINAGKQDSTLVKEILSILPLATHLDTSILYAKKAQKIARKINDINGLIKANYSLAVFFKEKGLYVDALAICEEAIKLNVKSNNALIHSKLYKVKGDCYRGLLDFESAERAYLIAQKSATVAKDTKYLSKVYTSMANMYDLKGEDKKAIEYHLLCLDIDKKLNDIEGQIVDYTNIAVIFSKSEDWPKVIEYAQKAKALDAEDSAYEASMILADAYRGTHQYEKAIALLKKTIETASLYGETYFINVSTINIANFLLDLDKNDEALEYAATLDCAEDADMFALDINLIKGTAYMQKKEYQTALQYFTQAKKVMHPNEEIEFKKSLNEKLAMVYEALQDEKQSLSHLKDAYSYKDSMYVIEKNIKIHELEKQYNINEKTEQISGHQNEIKRMKYWVGFLSPLLLLLSIGIYTFVRRNKRLNQENTLLSQHIESINNQPNPTLDQKSLVLNGQNKAAILLSEIIYLSASGNGTEIITSTQRYFEWQGLKALYDQITPSGYFVQTHRSYIVNYLHIKKLKANELIMSNEATVKIGVTYKENVKAWLSEKMK